MPFKHIWTEFGIEFRLYGVITIQDALGVHARFGNDPRSESARYRLIDLRDILRIKLSENEIEYIGAFNKAQSLRTPNIRSAFIIPDNRFDTSLRVYKSVLEGSSWEIKSFADETSARAWAQTH